MDCVKCKKSIPTDALFCPYCGKKQVSEKKKATRSRPNGSGTVYKRGKTWTAEFTHGYLIDSDGKRKAIRSYKYGFKTKKEALDYLPTLEAAPVKRVPKLIDLWGSFKESKKFQKLSDS